MKTIYLIAIVVATIVVVGIGVVFGVGSVLSAEEITVRHGTKSGAILLNLRNSGFLADCLIGADVYGVTKDGKRRDMETELHDMVMEGGVMKMRRVDKICVEPLSTVRMRGTATDGEHVMIFGDVHGIDHYVVLLKFQSGKTLSFRAEAPTTMGEELYEHEHEHE
ncbi:MAG: copper chaperone PCu(A)C [Thaumarchaeota archaeon]|nr:copper chaperone PCu(A)C [Candidatus Calditenuaceae archaeon]MDW8187352.1 copper chaperone PCu(A)C [Nitrososphaerota archaeon]